MTAPANKGKDAHERLKDAMKRRMDKRRKAAGVPGKSAGIMVKPSSRPYKGLQVDKRKR